MNPPTPDRPVIPLPADASADAIAAALRANLAPALTGFLPRQRWYGDKSRPLAAVSLVDAAVDGQALPWFVLAIAEVAFADGSPPARYLLPLATAPLADADDPVAILLADNNDPLALVDAIAAPGVPARLLFRLAESARLPGAAGTFLWQAFPDLAPLVDRAAAAPARPIGVEYSNSSIRFGDVLVLKLVRRLRAGVNPDEEVGRHLARRTPFRNFPIPLGSGHYQTGDGQIYPFALAQAFVANTADGWDDTLGRLTAPDPSTAALPAALLGRRSAELHLALATDTDDDAFAPQPVTAADADAWTAATRAHLASVAADLNRFRSDASAPIRTQIDRFQTLLPALDRRTAGFRHLIGTARCRVHGDYHLGQLLRTAHADWVILDFEGEPARPLAERRAKTSVLKDVAGMLRSFSYARSEAARRAGLPPAATDAADHPLARWEAATRQAFLAAYRSRLAAEPRTPPLVPPESARFAAATTAWEFDKAVYELAYELYNRPDWLPHALGTILHQPPTDPVSESG